MSDHGDVIREALPYTGNGSPPYGDVLRSALAALDALVARIRELEVENERIARAALDVSASGGVPAPAAATFPADPGGLSPAGTEAELIQHRDTLNQQLFAAEARVTELEGLASRAEAFIDASGRHPDLAADIRAALAPSATGGSDE